MRYAEAVWGFLAANPALLALLVGMVFSWGAALWAERVIFNPAIGKHAMQRAAIVVTSAACFIFAMLLWPVFDPTSRHGVRFLCSFGTAICSPFVYAGLTKWLGSRWPWLSSVFTNPVGDATGTLRTLGDRTSKDSGPAPPATP